MRVMVLVKATTDSEAAWAKRCPNPMPGPSELEIRPIFETANCGDMLTPQLAEQDAKLRDTISGG